MEVRNIADDRMHTVVSWPKVSVPVILEDRFAFNASRGWVLLQRACFWFLRKIGANAIGTDEHYTVRRFQTREIGEAVFRQHKEALRFFGGIEREDLCVIVGDEEFRKLLSDPGGVDPYGPLSLNVSARVGNSHGVTMQGFRVITVPWITGVHMVPARYFQ